MNPLLLDNNGVHLPPGAAVPVARLGRQLPKEHHSNPSAVNDPAAGSSDDGCSSTTTGNATEQIHDPMLNQFTLATAGVFTDLFTDVDGNPYL